MDRLDIYDRMPAGMGEYLSQYGWHFSKKLCEYAVSQMEKNDSSKSKITPSTKEQVENMLKQNGISLKNNVGYDACYVYNMAKSDFLGSSIQGEQQLAMYVKDYLDDPDGYEGIALTRYYADCIGKGKPLFWEDYL